MEKKNSAFFFFLAIHSSNKNIFLSCGIASTILFAAGLSNHTEFSLATELFLWCKLRKISSLKVKSWGLYLLFMQGNILSISGKVLTTPISLALEYFFFALQNGNLGPGDEEGRD